MKRLVALFCLIFCVILGGCTPHTDHLAPLRGDFEADISGEMNGVAFSALCQRETDENGGVWLTVTFYAPTSLADTVAKRAPDGTIALSVGELSVSAVPEGLSSLFDLLSPTGEVTGSALTEEGHTKVTGNGFAVTFLADGTPYLLENTAAKATVIRFAAVE